MVAIVSHQREHILDAVRTMYTRVASAPSETFHFPTGRKACLFVGYPESVLRDIPQTAVESFAGVGYPFSAGVIHEGDTVLDLGSGSGTDSLIASRVVGPRGKVYGLDLTAAMREKLTANARMANADNVFVLPGEVEDIPLADGLVDVVTSNGVLNLVPDKRRAIREIFRVLRPGGKIQIADIALAKPVSGRARRDPKLWAECVVGAVEKQTYLDLFREAGFKDVETLSQFDYFSGSSSEETREVAALFGAQTIVLKALKPQLHELPMRKQSPVKDAIRDFAKQVGAVAGAGIAFAACLGAPLLLSALSVIGMSGASRHAYLFPVFIGFIALALWTLYRSAQGRAKLGPFWLGLAGGVAAAAMMWVMVTEVYPLPWWLVYGALALLVAASFWDYIERQREDCLVEARREAGREKPALKRQVANGAAISVAAAAAFYGLYKSVDAFIPKAEAGEIACFGINACKGQTACATALNGCPGQNSCKGKGFLNATPKDCAAKGGVPLKGSPADPEKS
ncbi:MAG: BufA2 family periplasmic bufferin-type metallophore [Burkholderiales bacterium]